jgi:hypothetical protein
MAEGRKTGPTADEAFFEELGAVFEKFPRMARKYSVQSMGQDKGTLKIDFEKQIGFSRIEDKKIVTEFMEKAAANATLKEEFGSGEGPGETEMLDRFCCSWEFIGHRWECMRICS